MPPTYWIALSALLYTIADLTFKSWHLSAWPYGFWMAFAIYISGSFALIMSFFGENIALATIAAIVLNCVAYLVLSYILFNETISPLHLMGIGLGLIAIGLMYS